MRQRAGRRTPKAAVSRPSKPSIQLPKVGVTWSGLATAPSTVMLITWLAQLVGVARLDTAHGLEGEAGLTCDERCSGMGSAGWCSLSFMEWGQVV